MPTSKITNEQAIEHINKVTAVLRSNDSREATPEEIQLFLAKQVLGCKAIVDKKIEDESFKARAW